MILMTPRRGEFHLPRLVYLRTYAPHQLYRTFSLRLSTFDAGAAEWGARSTMKSTWWPLAGQTRCSRQHLDTRDDSNEPWEPVSSFCLRPGTPQMTLKSLRNQCHSSVFGLGHLGWLQRALETSVILLSSAWDTTDDSNEPWGTSVILLSSVRTPWMSPTSLKNQCHSSVFGLGHLGWLQRALRTSVILLSSLSSVAEFSRCRRMIENHVIWPFLPMNSRWWWWWWGQS